MALIKCPECGKDVSDKASACPSCACPIQPITIQATAKKWKGLQVLFGIIFAIGFVWLIMSAQANQPSSISILLAGVGLIGYLISRITAWWHHA